MIDQIKSISIMHVLDRLGIGYKKLTGGEYRIVQDGKMTDGWTFNVNSNLMNDFSKDRASGSTFQLVQSVLNLSPHETYEWFKDHFDLSEDGDGKKEQKKPIGQVRAELNGLSSEQIEYLQLRGIDYEKVEHLVKDYELGIGCQVHGEYGPIGLRTRKLTQDQKLRFQSFKGYPSDGIYKGKIDENKKYLIVVEGLFDFLTIVQYETNVVGLTSCKNGANVVKKLAKQYEIIYCYDNDEAGKESIALFKDINIRLFHIHKHSDTAKDINDFFIETGSSESIAEAIIETAEASYPIQTSFEKFYTFQKRIMEYGKLGFDGPFPEIDKYTSGIIPGKVFTIGASSNVGKSKLAYFFIQYFLKMGKKILFLNLEVDEAMCLGNVICAREKITNEDLIQGHKPQESYYRNLTIYDNIDDLGNIEEVVAETTPDIVFIDFVQNISAKGSSEYEKMASVAKKLQKLAIATNATLFNLSQLSNSGHKQVINGERDSVSLKGAGEFVSSSDVIFLLKKGESDNELLLKVRKSKYGKVGSVHVLKVDYARNQFVYHSELNEIQETLGRVTYP